MSTPTSSLKITKQLKHERERVFSALTDPAKMARWFIDAGDDTSVVRNELRPGGHYTITRTRGSETFVTHGTYLIVVPPERLVFSWFGCQGRPETRVTVELFAENGGTRLELTHELPEADIPPHRAGWATCFNNLDQVLNTEAGIASSPALQSHGA